MCRVAPSLTLLHAGFCPAPEHESREIAKGKSGQDKKLKGGFSLHLATCKM